MIVRRLALVGALTLAAAACGGGGKPAPAPIEGRGGEPAPAMTDPIAVLRALAQAARDDDGAALDALVHPVHGMWLWDQPGATVSPALHVTAGTGAPPTERLRASRMIEYWQESYWRHVAGGIDGPIDRLDRDPAERFAPSYGSCDTDETPPDLRSWLVAKDGFREHYEPILADGDHGIAPALMADMAHYRSWGLDVWLLEDRGRLWVAHVMVWTPCDA